VNNTEEFEFRNFLLFLKDTSQALRVLDLYYNAQFVLFAYFCGEIFQYSLVSCNQPFSGETKLATKRNK
jgi:hypothetical protein